MPISHCGPGLPGGDTRPPCCPGTTHYLSSVSSVSHLCGEDHGLPWVPIHSPTNFPGQRHLVLSRPQGVGGDAPDATGLMLNAPPCLISEHIMVETFILIFLALEGRAFGHKAQTESHTCSNAFCSHFSLSPQASFSIPVALRAISTHLRHISQICSLPISGNGRPFTSTS